MQNVSTLIRRPVPIGTAAASGFLAFIAGAVVALAEPTLVAELSAGYTSNASVSGSASGGEQIAHNRSETGLDGSASTGGEQTSRGRSEHCLTGQGHADEDSVAVLDLT